MMKDRTGSPWPDSEHAGSGTFEPGENGQDLPVRVIAREDAVFWLDGQGYWCNRHGRIQNRRIIQHFHASISRDAQGFYLTQVHPGYLEKIYFPYEDTALFVFQVRTAEPLTLILNTGGTIPLDPRELFIANDALYLLHDQERIKFSERALVQFSSHLEFRDDGVFATIGNQRVPIPEGL